MDDRDLGISSSVTSTTRQGRGEECIMGKGEVGYKKEEEEEEEEEGKPITPGSPRC